MSKVIRHELNKGIAFFVLLVLFPIGIILYWGVEMWKISQDITLIALVVLLVITLILIWLLYYFSIRTYYNSEYLIDGHHLEWKLGSSNSKIDIGQINYITKGTYPSGNRPALNFNGIKINYSDGYVIFLSPKNEQQFIKDLQSKNANIKFLKSRDDSSFK